MTRFTLEELESIRKGSNRPLGRIYRGLFENCSSKLARISQSTLADAEDAIMDSFLVMRDKIVNDAFRNDNVEAYLITIARNKLRNKNKRDRRLMRFEPAELEQKLSEGPPELENETEQRLQAIFKGMDMLGGKCQTLLKENMLEGIALKKLVERLNYSGYDVIKTTKSRCMKKLKTIIYKGSGYAG